MSANFELFDAPPVVLSSEDSPVPYAGNLEDLWLTSVDEIMEAARLQVKY